MTSEAHTLAPVDVVFLIECGAPFDAFSPRPNPDGQIFYVPDLERLRSLGWGVLGSFTPPTGRLRRRRKARVGSAVMLVHSDTAAVPSGTVGEAVAVAADVVRVAWPSGAEDDLTVDRDRWIALD